MSSTTSLRPFVMDRPIHFVSHASPEGIQANLYQDVGTRPVDHASRALTEEEKRRVCKQKKGRPYLQILPTK